VAPKSHAGRRRVPLARTLRPYLEAHRALQGQDGDGLCFGALPERPFDPPAGVERAQRAWRLARLEPIALQECRHTYAAFMIAAGVNAKALSSYMGHASITITLDRYGHLMPGAEEEAASMLDAYLDQGRSASGD
jgi:integrase